MKHRILSLLLCLILLGGALNMPVLAPFDVSYYNEIVYAGGILDLMAFVGEEDLSEYSFQWQFEGISSDSWVNLEDNSNYKGTKTNHLQVYTKADAAYTHWSEIPFRCRVTKGDETKSTPNIHMHIYPYSDMEQALERCGLVCMSPR